MDFTREEIERARRNHTAIRKPMLCDCNRCYGKTTVPIPYRRVKDHRKKYGRHPRSDQNTPDPFLPAARPPSPAAVLGSPALGSPAVSLRSMASSGRSVLGDLDTNSPSNRSGAARVSQSHKKTSSVASVSSLAPIGDSQGFVLERKPKLGGSSESVSTHAKSSGQLTLAPPSSPLFSSRYLEGLSPSFLLSRRNLNVRLLLTPGPLTPGDCTLDSPPRQNFDRGGDWLYDAGVFPASPPHEHQFDSLSEVGSEHSIKFLDEQAEQDYWDNLLEDDDLPEPIPLEHDPGVEAKVYGSEDEYSSDPDDPYFGLERDLSDLELEPEPEEPEPPPAEEQVVDDEAQEEPEDLEGDPDDSDDEEVAAAFLGHADLRNFFIRTHLQAAFHGATKRTIHDILLSHKLTLLAQAARGELAPDLVAALARFPLTLRALERRLGLDIEHKIRIYTLCPGCGTRYMPDYVENTDNPNCTHVQKNRTVCDSPLFTEVRLYGNKRKRKPIKQLPYYPFPKAFESMLIRYGMYDAMQLWRGPNDEIDDGPPLSYEDWLENIDEHTPLTHFWNGWAWYNQVAGMTRQYDRESGKYTDLAPDPPVALVRTRFGFSFSINIDGYRAFKKGTYSSVGVYVTVNNLPYYLRNRVKNMMAVMVMPGPNKPNAYEFDQMIEPLVDDLIAFARGIPLKVFQMGLNRAERELVHGHLHALVLDHMARIEVCGHAALATEKCFCLYCKMRRSWMAIPEGYEVENYKLRDPDKYLQAKYKWLQNPRRRTTLFRQNGARFTVMDKVPGFFGNTSCPVDAMHVFTTGTTKWLITSIILEPGMLGARYPRQPEDERPSARFDAGLSRIIFPSFCSWIPPSLSNFTSRVKSEGWYHIVPILPVLLWDALRVGDFIPDGPIPRGSRKSTAYAHQQKAANRLLKYRTRIYRAQTRKTGPPPTIEDCAANRDVHPFYKNIIRYCVTISILNDNSVTIASARLGIDLLSRCASNFSRMNYHLSPNFHSATHIEYFLHKFGGACNTWCFPYERGNKFMVNTNHNGHGLGTLETTMLQGYLKKTESIRILRQLQELPDPTDDDKATIEMMLKEMRTGPERELYREMLDEVLAGNADFQGYERVQLASNPAKVPDLRQVPAHWELICEHITSQLDGEVIYSDGLRPDRGIRLLPKGSTLSYSHLTRSRIRFGVAGHAHGDNARFGYIHNRVPVIIRRIYESSIRFPNEDEPRKYVTVLVQRFKRHATHPDPRFPWRKWNNWSRIDAWAEEEYEEIEAIKPEDFTGTFALYPVTLSHGPYWLTIAMKPVAPEHLN